MGLGRLTYPTTISEGKENRREAALYVLEDSLSHLVRSTQSLNDEVIGCFSPRQHTDEVGGIIE